MCADSDAEMEAGEEGGVGVEAKVALAHPPIEAVHAEAVRRTLQRCEEDAAALQACLHKLSSHTSALKAAARLSRAGEDLPYVGQCRHCLYTC